VSVKARRGATYKQIRKKRKEATFLKECSFDFKQKSIGRQDENKKKQRARIHGRRALCSNLQHGLPGVENVGNVIGKRGSPSHRWSW
jgi:hypothetical protein